MKILVFSDDFPPDVAGGAGMMAFRITKEFLKQGHEVFVLSTTDDKNNAGKSEVDGIHVYRVYSHYHERWRSYRSICNTGVLAQVKETLLEFKPDVVHAHNVHMHLSYASLCMARRYGAKVFMTAHDIMPFYPGTFTEFIDPKDLSCPTVFNYSVTALMLLKKFRYRYNPLRNFFIKKVLRRIDGVIAVSDTLKEALSQNGIKNVTVIHNGIDVSAWKVSPDETKAFKHSHGVDGTDVVLFGGRLSGAKGGDLILQAMHTVTMRNSSARLLVVGKKDAYAERMEKRAKELSIGDKVVFSGWLPEGEMKKAYAASTLVVVPSVCFDSFPNGNLEAFAVGRPVVSTCFGGSREIVRDGENGYIVNPFNVPFMSEAIGGLLSDKEKARRFGENGRKLVAENYSIEEVAKKYVLLFRK